MPIPTIPAEAGTPELSHTPFLRIRSAIYDGTLVPAEYLDTSALCSWLGLGVEAVHAVLRELGKIGLVDVRDIEKPRVVLPALDERDEIIQCLGALLGGVSRVTVPTLGEDAREALLMQLDHLVLAVNGHDPFEYAVQVWEMIETLIHDCPNQPLARATQGRIEALAFLISLTQAEEQPDWERLENSFMAFRSAVAAGDAIEAELALETAFRITSHDTSVRSPPATASLATGAIAGDVALAQMVGALLGGVVRLTIGDLPKMHLAAILNAAECAQGAARERDTEQHREWASRLVLELLAHCPNRHLVNAVRGTIDSLGDRVQVIWVQQSSNWDVVLNGYEQFINAVRDQDAVLAELSFEQACLL